MYVRPFSEIPPLAAGREDNNHGRLSKSDETLSGKATFAVTSPLVALSKNICVAGPPMELRSPVTVIPVLVGSAPGVTVAVKRVVPPGLTLAGVANCAMISGFVG